MSQLPKGRGLFIAEKSSAQNDFKKVYDQISSELPYQLDFQRFRGHVVRLQEPKDINPNWSSPELEDLPIIPDKFLYKIGDDDLEKKRYQDVYDTILNNNYDFIVCGTDYEREGNLIFDAFMSTLPTKYQNIPKYRMWGKLTVYNNVEKI